MMRNVWWVIDYNRQSLTVLFMKVCGTCRKGVRGIWLDVVRIKYGRLQRAAFAEEGGAQLKDWIDQCPNQDYAALTFMGGCLASTSFDDLGDQGAVTN